MCLEIENIPSCLLCSMSLALFPHFWCVVSETREVEYGCPHTCLLCIEPQDKYG